MDPKQITKLAAACRKAGIKHFKTADFEFTLTDEAPVSAYKAAKTQAAPSIKPDAAFTSDELDQEALMYWSTSFEKPAEEDSA